MDKKNHKLMFWDGGKHTTVYMDCFELMQYYFDSYEVDPSMYDRVMQAWKEIQEHISKLEDDIALHKK